MNKNFITVVITLLCVSVITTLVLLQTNDSDEVVLEQNVDTSITTNRSTIEQTTELSTDGSEIGVSQETILNNSPINSSTDMSPARLGIIVPTEMCDSNRCIEKEKIGESLDFCLAYTFMWPMDVGTIGSRVVTSIEGNASTGCKITSYFLDDYYYVDSDINLKDRFLRCFLPTSSTLANSEQFYLLISSVMQGYKTYCTGTAVDMLALTLSPETQIEIIAEAFSSEYAALLSKYSTSTVPELELLNLIGTYSDDDMKSMSVEDLRKHFFQHPAEILSMLSEYKKTSELSVNISQRYQVDYKNIKSEGGGILSFEFERHGRGLWKLSTATIFPESYLFELKKMRESAQ